MKKTMKQIWIALFIIIFLIIFLTVYGVICMKQGYIMCAKDFYKGEMKVDLIENADGTKEWKWIK